MSVVNLYEAYNQIYDDSTFDVEDILSDDDLDILEELDDETLEEIVEDIILDLLLDEDYDVEDIEDIFEEVLSEAKVTMGRGGEAGEGKVTVGSGSRMAASDRLAARKARKRQEAIARVKGAVKSGVERAKSAVKSGIESAKAAGKSGVSKARELVDKPAREYAAKREIVPSKSGKAYKSADWIKNQKQSTSSGRREVRSRVAADLVSRAKNAVTSRVNAAKSAAKSTAKKAVGRAAGAVASRATRLANRMAEELDLYDVVLEHLLNEGYADTLEDAEVIMVNMSDEWREDIIDEANKAEQRIGGKGLSPTWVRGQRNRKYYYGSDSDLTRWMDKTMRKNSQYVTGHRKGGDPELKSDHSPRIQSHKSKRGVKKVRGAK